MTLLDAIRQVCGSAPEHIKTDGFTRFSTNGQRSNRDGWGTKGPDGTYHFGCWRQHVSGQWKDPSSIYTSNPRALTSRFKSDESNSDDVRRTRINSQIWSSAVRIVAKSPVGLYLQYRGLNLTYYPAALRMAALPYYENGQETDRYSSMLGAVTDKSGKLVALHRTYLSYNGSKAPVAQPKKLTPASGALSGASIKLIPPKLLHSKITLGVAEGIETALACYSMFGVPTWSCVSATGLRSFEWPQGLERLVIFSDNDTTGVGQLAAQYLAGRAAATGLEVRKMIPEVGGTDWLDVYAEGQV